MRLSHLPFLPRWFWLHIVRGMGEFWVFPLHSPALGEIPAWLLVGWMALWQSAAASIIIDGWIFNHNSEHQSLSGWNARGVRFIYALTAHYVNFWRWPKLLESIAFREHRARIENLVQFLYMCLLELNIKRHPTNVWSLFLALCWFII